MSVPLDRLYDFLQTLCNHDVLIYRYLPHGSRKIADCTSLNKKIVVNNLDKMCMVCHDQESLNYKEFEPHVPIKQEHRQLLPVLQSITCMYGSLYDKILLCHSEKHSKDLDWFQQHGSIGVYYWSHAVIARDWYRYAQHDTRLDTKQPVKDFLIYNRAWSGLREYRLKFTELVTNADLQKVSRITFNPVDNGMHYKTYQVKNPDLQLQRWDLENILPSTDALASASADYNIDDYRNHRIEVILETVFDDNKWHLTEKTLRPIACGMPFILASTAGSLQYLRSYGFRTFGSVWDESYDSVADPVQRLHSIVDLMKSLASMSDRDKISMQSQVSEIAAFNRRRFFSDDFWHQVVNEFVTNFDAAAAEMQQYQCAMRNHLGAHYQTVNRS
jgi:hypothetical protein